jgi:hypothetical protein
MSLLTNTTTFRMGSFKRWIAPWYETNPLYSNLIYNELYIYEFLNGIYYQLKIPNTLPIIYNINYNQLIIRIQLYLFKKKKQKRSSVFFKYFLHFYKDHKQILWFLLKILYLYNSNKLRIKYKNIDFNFDSISKFNIQIIPIKKRQIIDNYYADLLKLRSPKNKIYVFNKKYSFLLNKYNKNNRILNNFNNTEVTSTFFSKNNLYISYFNQIKEINNNLYIKINNIFYKMYTSIFFYNIYKYIIKKKIIVSLKKYYNNKLIIKNKQKYINLNNYWKLKKIYNLKINKLKFKKNKKLYILQNKKYKNIYKSWNLEKKNKYINKIRKKKIKYLNNKNNKLIFYKKKYKLRKKFKIKNKYRLIKKKKYIKRNLLNKIKIKKKIIKRKKKIKFKKLKKKYRRNNIIINNKLYFFLLFIWLIKKIITWILLLILQLIIYNELFNILFNNKKKIKLNNILIYNNLKKIIIFLNNIKKISFLEIKKNKLFNNKKKLIKLNNIIHNFKINIKKKKNWYNRYYTYIMLNHLKLKIINTLKIYMNKNILFLPYYKKKHFPFLHEPKIISDYLRIKMQYAKSIRYVLISLVKKHTRQKYRRIRRKKRYVRKLYNFKIRIKEKLNIHMNKFYNIYLNINNKKKKKKKYNINYINNINKQINIKKNNKKRKFKKYNKNNINKIKYLLLNSQLEKKKKKYLKKKLKYKNIKKKKRKYNQLKKIKKRNLLNKYKKWEKYKKKTNNIFFIWKKYFKKINYRQFPLIGIRIECAGPTRKGKRTRIIHYNEWVNYYKLPGKMPNSTVMTDVQYWQTYARIKRASIGIKIWLFLHTPYYSNTFNTEKKAINNFNNIK